MKNVVIIFGTLIVLVNSSIVGCGKTKEEKGNAEQNRTETSISATEETLEKRKAGSNSVSMPKEENIPSFEEKENSEAEKGVRVGSAGECVKQFYSAVHKRNYPAAMNYLSSVLIEDILEKHAMLAGQSVEGALDGVTARDILNNIIVLRQDELPIPASQDWRFGTDGKIWSVKYRLNFNNVMDKLLEESIRHEYVVEKNGMYQIDWFYWAESSIPEFLAKGLFAKPCDYSVVDVSRSPSGEEGWMSYIFDIVVKNSSNGLVRRDLVKPDIYAISDGRKCGRQSYYTLTSPLTKAQKYYHGEVLLPACFTHHIARVSVPSRAAGVDFYMVTPDLRCFSIPVEGPFSPLPEFSPSSVDQLVFGEPLTIEDSLEVTFLGLTATDDPDQLYLWGKVKNLTMHDAQLHRDLCFVLASRDWFSGFLEVYETKTIPPLYEKITPLEVKLTKGENYVLIVGTPNLEYQGGWEELEKLRVWKTYRFEAQPTPTLESPKVKIELVKGQGEWGGGGSRYPFGQHALYSYKISVRIRNSGDDLPVYIEAAKVPVYTDHSGAAKVLERSTDVKKWIEPGEEITISLPCGYKHFPRIKIRVLTTFTKERIVELEKQSLLQIFGDAPQIDIEVVCLDGKVSCTLQPEKQTSHSQQLARAEMLIIDSGLQRFWSDCDRYPNDAEGLQALYVAPADVQKKWNGPYLKLTKLLDPWGNPYVYVAPTNLKWGEFDLISYGADGIEGGEGNNQDLVR